MLIRDKTSGGIEVIKVNDPPKGIADLKPAVNSPIKVRIGSDWVSAFYNGVNRYGMHVITLHDKSVMTINCFHEVKAEQLAEDSGNE